MRLCPASSPPRVVVPALVFSRTRRPPVRVVSPPRASSSPRASSPRRIVPLPHRGRRQRQPKRDTSDARRTTTRAVVAAYMVTMRARARCGGATRARRRRGAQLHTECAPPIGHLPARTVVDLDVWSVQSVDSQSESPQQGSPFNFRPNVQGLESINGGCSTFPRESQESKIPIQYTHFGKVFELIDPRFAIYRPL